MSLVTVAVVAVDLALSAQLASETHEPHESVSEATATAAEKRPPSWFAFPVLFWLPETKLGLAGAAGLHFRLDGGPRASSVFAVAGFSIKKQGTADLSSDLYLRGGTLVSARVRAVHYPDWYYGIGPRTSSAGHDQFTYRYAELIATAGFPVLGERLRAGPRLAAHAEESVDIQPGGLVDTSGLPGLRGFRALGLGAAVTWDTRDSPLWPSHGVFAQANYVYFPEAIAGPGFGTGTLDLRLFRPLPRATVLGLGLLLDVSDGDVPLSQLSKIGSSTYLRGYRDGRYRDRIAWAGQAELRVPLSARFSGAAFAGAGDVARSFADMGVGSVKVAGGLGLRYRLTGEGANLRLDVAGSVAGVEFYLVLLEAF